MNDVVLAILAIWYLAAVWLNSAWQLQIFARGDGGFGGPREGAPEPHKLPDRAPDMSIDAETRPDQALLYRLSGDRNPLHSDPEFAKAVGFPKPILHGLCTYGTCCRAIISGALDYDPTQITGFDVRFSAPVFPGDTVTVDLWKDKGVISFRARVKERDAVARNELKRKIGVKLNGRKIYFISPDDLILSKLRWFQMSESTRHLEDIKSILKISKGKIDRNYLEREAKKQNTFDILLDLI